MAVAIDTAVLLVVWLIFVFSARNPDRGSVEAEHDHLRTTRKEENQALMTLPAASMPRDRALVRGPRRAT